jgi:hypothetical protein
MAGKLCACALSGLMVGWICRSTLLKAIGRGLVVGFPRNIRALYVDQLEVSEERSSVLEVVTSADKEVVLWRRQAQLLQVLPLDALDSRAAYLSLQSNQFSLATPRSNMGLSVRLAQADTSSRSFF